MTEKAGNPLREVIRDFERVAPEVVAQAATYQAAILADVAGRRGTAHGRISALDPRMKLAGPAFTVEVRPGDNLMIHAAMTMAKPGDILVIDGKAAQTCALMGAIMVNACRQLKLGGIVMDGAMRDSLELRELGFPVFCTGTNPNGPTKFVPGRINWPVSVGGIAVSPGDLVVADADGVVFIERGKAAAMIPLAKKKVEDENKRIDEIRSNKNLRPGWLEGALRAAGVLKDGEKL
ncbi:MAG: RraA family protein [Clostridia bacterium]